MQVDPTRRLFTPDEILSFPKAIDIIKWVRVWDELPMQGVIVPVWDADYMYYASYWDKDGLQFWVIADMIVTGDGDMDMRKKAGEQVYPIKWLKIEAPTK